MPSEAYNALVTMLSGGRVTPEAPVEQARMGWDAMENLLPLAPDVTIEETKIGDLNARWLTPPGAGGTTVLHLHGGGYVIGSAKSHTPFASHLAATLGAPVLVLEYRLAPEHPAPAAIDDTVAAYEWLLESGIDPADIVFTGDSAGGGLAVATMAQLRDTLLPLPGAAALLSPWTDATFAFDSMLSKVDEDIVLSPELMQHLARVVCRFDPVDDPRLSPALGDLAGMPPIHVQVGTCELLLDDARQFADKASGAGVDVTLEVCDEMIHIWPVLGAGVTPESQEAINRIAAFLRG